MVLSRGSSAAGCDPLSCVARHEVVVLLEALRNTYDSVSSHQASDCRIQIRIEVPADPQEVIGNEAGWDGLTTASQLFAQSRAERGAARCPRLPLNALISCLTSVDQSHVASEK